MEAIARDDGGQHKGNFVRLLRPDWHFSQHYACVASGTEGRRAPPFHETVESGHATGLVSPLEIAASQSRKIKSPSKKETRLDASHTPLSPAREGREFFS